MTIIICLRRLAQLVHENLACTASKSTNNIQQHSTGRGTRGGKSNTASHKGGAILVKAVRGPGVPIYDAFPRDHMIRYLNLFMGLSIPRVSASEPPTATCPCWQIFDTFGHQALTCRQWSRAKAKLGHDFLVQALVGAIRACRIQCSHVLRNKVPTHTHLDHQADILLSRLTKL